VAEPGYHLATIPKGELGEASKVLEECMEFMDAVQQNVRIMALCELADLQGAIKAYLQKHHPGIYFDDLDAMRRVTERAFRNGRRR
jgi:NTP pyrophosphatase (non-canonical NTP hydrolase)